MFRIAINKLSGCLFSRVLASHAGGPGSNRSTCQSWDLQIRKEITLVKSLYIGDSKHTELARRQLGNKPCALQVLFGLHPSKIHVCSCMFM